MALARARPRTRARRHGADPHRRPRHVPVRDRRMSRCCCSAPARRARTRWGRTRCARATASRPSRCRTSSRCAATRPTGCPGAKGIGAKTARRPAAAQGRPRARDPRRDPREAAVRRALIEQADELREFQDIATLRTVPVERPRDRPTDLPAAPTPPRGSACAGSASGRARCTERSEQPAVLRGASDPSATPGSRTTSAAGACWISARTCSPATRYDEISMAQIAREAGISKALLYHYFPSKQDYFVATLATGAEELRARVEPDPRSAAGRGADRRARRVPGVDRGERARPTRSCCRARRRCPRCASIVEGVRATTVERILDGPRRDRAAPRAPRSRGWLWFMDGACLDWIAHRDLDRGQLLGLLLGTLFGALMAAGVQLPATA